MLDLKKELNKSQYEAALHLKGPLLVIAGAGSGKTRVITYRIVNLIQNHKVAPWRIMAVTFTNKAAKEMSERIESLLGDRARCWISTFHASCAKILRKHGESAGVDPKFTIYDDQDQKAMITRVLKELNISTKQFPPRAVQSEINKSKRELINPSEYPESDIYRRTVKQIYELYERRMKDSSALDFGDLLYRTVRAMQENPSLAKEISGQFDYVMIDEFQDTNKVQLELIRMLTPHHNICVVGDDDQSIYSWRGADVTNILDFEKLFKGAKVVTLERNYRSTKNILTAAHGVISKLHDRRPKELWTKEEGGDKVGIFSTPDERDEARIVARKIKELLSDGVSYSEQVVFYRTNAQSRVFEEVFRSQNIPHKIVGGMRFYERAEVKDMIAYLRLVRNPADHTAFIRVINTPTRGIGKTTIDKLVAIASGYGESAFEAIDRAADEIGKAPAQKLLAFKKMALSWQIEAEEGLFNIISKIIEDTGYIVKLETENTAEADARIENIKELVGSIEDFEQDAETADLENFLELVALQSDVDTANFNEPQVTMMTIHAAKGLEFNTVYVTGLEEGLFPLIRQSDMMLDDVDAIDEERRLAYVAMTRARKQLFLSRAVQRRLYGQSKTSPPSRFLANVPVEVCKNLSEKSSTTRLVQQGGAQRTSFGAQSRRFGYNGTQQQSSSSSNWSSTSNKNSSKKSGINNDETWVDSSFDQSPSANKQIFPGQTVSHPKFGQGKVMGIIPGAKPKADILFPGFGRKTILVKFLDMD